jgi:hypothetical protein
MGHAGAALAAERVSGPRACQVGSASGALWGACVRFACRGPQVKRGCIGTFHKVSKKYLPLYFAEFQFRYNNRENRDIFGTAISQC